MVINFCLFLLKIMSDLDYNLEDVSSLRGQIMTIFNLLIILQYCIEYLQRLILKVTSLSSAMAGFKVTFRELLRTEDMIGAAVRKELKLFCLIFSQYE